MLRPYQQHALQATKDNYAKGRNRQLVVLPTGMGKTVVFANIPEFHSLRKRMLVIVHRDELATQAQEKFRHWNPGFRVGVEMGALRCHSSDRVVITSVQSIGRAGSRRLLQFAPDDFDAIVCDEAHHSTAASYIRVFEHFGFVGRDESVRRLLLGFTATPNRGDGQGLAKVYDEIVFNYSMLQAIREGWLSDVRGIRVKTGVSLDGVRIEHGDFATGELESAVNTPERNDMIARQWMKQGQDRQTIAFTVDIQHAKDLAGAFKKHGVDCEALWGNDPDRAVKLKHHKAGQLRVLANCGVLTEGYDDWGVRCIIMARPTKSQLLFVQMAGRGTRIPNFPDGISLIEARQRGLVICKDDCLIMDVTDNCTRHSLVTLPTIFGLGAKLDTKGKKISEVVSQMEMAQAMHPNADLSNLDDINRLDAYVHEVDLFKVKFDQTVVDNSLLQWHRTPAGHYALLLPFRERVLVYHDLLDKWNVDGLVNGNHFEDKGFCDVADAIKAADRMVTQFGGELLPTLRRQPDWNQEKATEAQLYTLRRVTKEWPNKPNFDALTKGEASLLLNKIFSEMWARRQEARTT